MTVSELIKELQKYDGDRGVAFCSESRITKLFWVNPGMVQEEPYSNQLLIRDPALVAQIDADEGAA